MRDRKPGKDVREYSFEDDGRTPNNPMLPLLVYPQALTEDKQNPSSCKELLAENGWGGAWVDPWVPEHPAGGATVPRHARRGAEGRVDAGLAVTRLCRAHVTA